MNSLEEIRKNPGADGPTLAHWPRDVRSLSIDGLSLIGVDSEGKIYYDGKPIAYQATLAVHERRIAWIIAVFIALGAIGSLIQAYFSWH